MSKCHHAISLVLCGLTALIYLSASGGFWTQLRTYAWQSVPAIILTSEVQTDVKADGARGKVTFKYLINGTWHEGTDFVVERYSWGDVKQKTVDCIARHEPGKMITSYLSPDHSSVSLGHFPRFYDLTNALWGVSVLLMTLFLAWQVWRANTKPQPVAASLAPLPLPGS